MTRWSAQDVLRLEQPRIPGDAKKWATGDKPILEAEVQRAVLQLLRKHPLVGWAHRFNSRVVDVVDKKSKKGTRPMFMSFKGCPDILGQLKTGAFLAIECKSTIGKLTPEQAEFLSLVNQHGGLAFVARSVDDVLKYLPLR